MKLLVFGQPGLKVDQLSFEKLLHRCRQAGWDVRERTSTNREDIAAMEIYDIVQTPAFLLTQDDGRPVGIWQDALPSYEELAARYLSV